MSNIVYIATSLDGYISDKNGELDRLQMVPNPNNSDFGWTEFLDRIDAVIMGRKTFEKICSFDCDWPYPKPVFVLSRFLKSLPEEYEEKAELILLFWSLINKFNILVFIMLWVIFSIWH